MNLIITINLDNAVFEGNMPIEVSKILRLVVNKLQNGREEATILDSNGNKVGEFNITKE
jgi:hypothetical protein